VVAPNSRSGALIGNSQMKIFITLAFIALTVSVAVAENKNPATVSKEKQRKGAATPREAVERFANAMVSMDKNELLACCAGNEAQMKVVAVMADFGQAILAFKKKFIKVYGEQAWKDFQDPNKKRDGGDARLSIPSADDLKKVKEQKIEIKPDGTATFTQIGSLQSGKLVKMDGRWFVDAGSMLPPNAKPEAFAKMMGKFAALVAKYQKAIGHEGISGEDIDAELGRDIAKTMLGFEINKPHRFDIDKI